MTGGRNDGRRRTGLAAGLAAAVVAVLAGAVAWGGGFVASAAGDGRAAAEASAAGVPAAAPAQVRAAVPLAVRIPSLGIDSELVPLAVDPAGALAAPESADIAGWFAAGTVPGEVGPAVIAGHVDSRSGPGVFVALPELRPGDEVEVVRSDGVAVFEVRSTESVAKGEFPTEGVYGPTPLPELRLITCGGEFDPRSGHYRSNVIVRAELVADPVKP